MGWPNPPQVTSTGCLRTHPDFYERTFQFGDRMRCGLAATVEGLDVAATVVGFGGVFALYFGTGETHGYRDLLRNDSAAMSSCSCG